MDFAEQLKILEAAQGQPGALALALIDITFHALPESERNELKEALQAAAVPHWVTPAILAHLLEVSEDIAAERLARLRQLTVMEPFRARGEGACNVHESTRLALRQQLWSDDHTRSPFIALSARARQWFAQQPDPEERIEALYHHFVSEPQTAATAWDKLNRALQQPQHRQNTATALAEHLNAQMLSGTAQAAALLALGWWRRSRAEFSGLLAQAEQALALAGDDLWLDADASCLKGRALENRGDLSAALKAYQHHQALILALTQRDPNNADWQRDLSVSYNDMGRVKQAQGDLAGAAQAYQRSNAIMLALTQRDPDNADWQRDLSASYSIVGGVKQAQGDLAGAAQAYQQFNDIMLALSQRDPDNADWQRDLSVSYSSVGRVKQAQGDLAGAAQAYQQDLDIMLALTQRDLDNAGWQRELSVSYNCIGSVKQAQGDLAGAAQAYQKGLDIMLALIQRDPDNADLQRDLSVSYNDMGLVKQAQGDLVGAAQAYQQFNAIMLALTQCASDNAGWQRELYTSHWNLGYLRDKQKEWPAAAEHYAQALDIAKKLQQADKLNAEDKGDVDLIRAALRRVRSK
jgi:tetratricopeptide (TPR) repeat protein